MLFDEFTEVVAIASLLIPLQSAFEAVDYIGEEVNAMAGAEDEAIAMLPAELHLGIDEIDCPLPVSELVQLLLHCPTLGQYLGVVGVVHGC